MGIMDLLDLTKGLLGTELMEVTTVQREALGKLLFLLGEKRHFLIYDINQKSFFCWSGEEWV